MKLSGVQVSAIAAHLGYGNPAARLWFIGAEEGLGGAASKEENAENLVARSKWPPIVDMDRAHRTLKERAGFIDISGPRAGHVGVWQWMAKIARAFEGHGDFCQTSKATSYVRARDGLGREKGQTFLTELSPFPSKTSNRPFELQHVATRDLEDSLVQRRKRQLALMREGPAKCVICYGSSRRKAFATHLGLSWEPLPGFRWFSSSKKERVTTIYRGELRDGSRTFAHLFMLPFLGQGALSHDVLTQFVSSKEFQASRGVTG